MTSVRLSFDVYLPCFYVHDGYPLLFDLSSRPVFLRSHNVILSLDSHFHFHFYCLIGLWGLSLCKDMSVS